MGKSDKIQAQYDRWHVRDLGRAGGWGVTTHRHRGDSYSWGSGQGDCRRHRVVTPCAYLTSLADAVASRCKHKTQEMQEEISKVVSITLFRDTCNMVIRDIERFRDHGMHTRKVREEASK